jgi:hypothetical protein
MLPDGTCIGFPVLHGWRFIANIVDPGALHDNALLFYARLGEVCAQHPEALGDEWRRVVARAEVLRRLRMEAT